MSGMIKTVVFKGVRDLEIQEFPIPAIPADKVLVKIEASAICTWEQRVYTGVKQVQFPFVGGHEMSGVITELGRDVDKRHWHVGDKVVIGVTLPCKHCYQCKMGNEQNCEHFNHTQPIVGLPYMGMGGLSSHLVVSPVNVFKYNNVSPEEASITEPVSCVVHSVESAGIQFGESAMVIGCGIMGLLHVMLAARKGACVIASDVNEERLALARKLGASYTVNPQKEDTAAKLMEYTNGNKVQVVFDTTPLAKVAQEALQYLSNKGRLVLYSSFYPDTPIPFSPDWLHKSGAAIMGTANSNTQDFMKAALLISQRVIDVRDLVSEVYDVKDAKQALESASKADKFRVVIRF